MPLTSPSKINHGKSRGSPVLRSKSRNKDPRTGLSAEEQNQSSTSIKKRDKSRYGSRGKNSRSYYQAREDALRRQVQKLQSKVPNERGDIVPKGYNKGQLGVYLPQQKEILKRGFESVGPESYLSRLAQGDQKLFEEMEKPAWRQFQQAQGELGSRFAELAPGAMSARKGTGFQNAAEQQSSDFALGLQSKRQELQRQAILDLQGISKELLAERPYEKFLAPKQQKAPREEKSWVEEYGPIIQTGATLAAAAL